MKSSQTQEKLIVFSRYPEPGTTKTRLAAALGSRKAAVIQKRMTGQTIRLVREFSRTFPVSLSIYFNGGSRGQISAWLGPDLDYRKQIEGDLGQRMAQAFTETFKRNYRRAVIIGADCPYLTVSHLEQAFAILQRHDLVLGPAADGGYYLIGLSRPAEFLFENIAWSTGRVLAATLEIARRHGLATQLLETLNDVDRPEDLKHLGNNSDLKRG